MVDVWWDGGVGVEGYAEGAGMGVGREVKLWFDVDSGGGKDEASGGESGGEGASKTITDKVLGANFADADAFKNMVTKWIKWVPHAHRGAGSVGKRGRRSFHLIVVVNSQLARRFEGTLRQRPMRG